MNESNKSIADVTRKNNSARLANTLIPQAPKIVAASTPNEPKAPILEEQQDSTVDQSQTVAPAKSDKKRTGVSFNMGDVTGPTPDKSYTKQINVCEEHHELLRQINFKYRKPMTAILHNVMELLRQAYEKENQK